MYLCKFPILKCVHCKVVLAAKFYAYGMPYDVHEFEVKARVKSEGQGVKESSREKEVVLTIPVHMRSEMTLFGCVLFFFICI